MYGYCHNNNEWISKESHNNYNQVLAHFVRTTNFRVSTPALKMAAKIGKQMPEKYLNILQLKYLLSSSDKLLFTPRGDDCTVFAYQ